MPGRKPKPTKLKQVLGNPGNRPLNTAEPEPQGEVRRPKFLKGRAAKIWDEYAPELIRLKILTVIGAHTFAAWCCLTEEFEKDSARMTASRISQMRALASSFGLDASAMSRIRVPDEKPASDPADKYLGKIITVPGNALRQ